MKRETAHTSSIVKCHTTHDTNVQTLPSMDPALAQVHTSYNTQLPPRNTHMAAPHREDQRTNCSASGVDRPEFTKLT